MAARKRRTKKSRIKRIDDLLVKIIKRHPMNSSFTDNPRFKKLNKERNKILGTE